MKIPRRLSAEELESRLGDFPKWRINEDGKLSRTFQFSDFAAAFSFLTAIAIEAEKLNHHPEIYNVYSTVRLELTTHDAGGLTELDFKLTTLIEKRL